MIELLELEAMVCATKTKHLSFSRQPNESNSAVFPAVSNALSLYFLFHALLCVHLREVRRDKLLKSIQARFYPICTLNLKGKGMHVQKLNLDATLPFEVQADLSQMLMYRGIETGGHSMCSSDHCFTMRSK